MTNGSDDGSDNGGSNGGGDSNGNGNGGDSTGSGVGNLLFPASIEDPATRTLSVQRTLNGVMLSDSRFGGREGSLPIADTDGDGISDYVFLAPAGMVSECAAGVLLPSATISSSTLTTSDLEGSLRIIYGSGGNCLDVTSIYEIGDVNGDDRIDIAAFVSPATGYGPGVGAVIFGGLTDSLIDVRSLDGQNGFSLDDVVPAGFDRGLTTLGDFNADGFDDVLVKTLGESSSQAWKIIEGRAGFPANRSSDELDDGEILLTLRPQAYIEAAGDVDGNGADDILALNRVELGPQVIYGRSGITNATIADGVELVRDCSASTYCAASALGDVDADGFDDLVVNHSLGTSGCGYGARSAIFYGSSNGTTTVDTLDNQTTPSVTRLVEAAASPCIAGGGFGDVGDIDGDGITDFGMRGASSDAIVFGRSGSRPDIIWLDDMDGSVGFRLPRDHRNGPLDVDGNGRDDVVFEDGSAFPGQQRSLDENGPGFTRIERGPAFLSARWNASTLSAAAGYRLEFGGRLVEELNADTLTHTFDPLDGAAAEITLSVIDENGSVLSQSVRQVPAYEPLESLSSIIYGARLVQISFGGDPAVQRYGRYLIWRNGVPLARAPAGAHDYVDDTVQPGTSYEYHVTPDYLPPNSLDATASDASPVIWRRSETIELATPAG